MKLLTNEQSRRIAELLNDVTGTSRQTLVDEALKIGRESALAVEPEPEPAPVEPEIPAEPIPPAPIEPQL